MAIKLSTIETQLIHDFIEINTGDGKEKIAFSYKGYSPAVSREVEELTRAAMEAGTPSNATLETLVRVLTHIDILDEEDKPIVISAANLMRVPFFILNAIITKILEAANPKKNS